MASSVPGARPSPFAVLRRRNFALLWTGQLVSTIGSALTSIAAGILVYRLTGSALSVVLTLMATVVPNLVIGLIAGVYVDRMDRKRILMVSDLLRGLLVLLIPVLVALHIAWLYVVILASSAITTFFDPAFEAILPELAPDEELGAANALMSISSFGSNAVGFAAAGLISSTIGIDWAFRIDAATFVFSAACVFLARLPEGAVPDLASSVSSVSANLRTGLRYLFSTPILRSLVVAFAIYYLSVGIWNSLLLPFSERALHATEFEYSLQEGLTSVGFVAASLLMANYVGRLREGQWLALSFLAMGATGILYASTSSIPFAILLVTISGFANAPGNVGKRLIIQRHTPRDLRGRVNSAYFVQRDIVFLAGMALAGLADVVDVRDLVMASAVLLVGAGLFALVLPGLGQPAAEWRRSVAMLRAAPATGGLTVGRIPTLEDLDRLVGHLPALGDLHEHDRESLLTRGLVREAEPGTRIVTRGERGTAAYFILEGTVLVGHPREDGSYRSLATLTTGDYFGEVAALTGSPRTADVATTEPTTLLEVPAEVLRGFMDHEVLNRLILTTMSERLAQTYSADLPRLAGLGQEDLLDLRTPRPESSGSALEANPA
jgi:CRP-like cAMP-binding protein/predicted MFS family arabinose efflux permease